MGWNGSNTDPFFLFVSLQSRSKWHSLSTKTSQAAAHGEKSLRQQHQIQTTNTPIHQQLEEFLQNEEIDSQILNILEFLPDCITDTGLNTLPHEQFMGNQQIGQPRNQTIGVKKSCVIGEQLNTPVIGKLILRTQTMLWNLNCVNRQIFSKTRMS